MQLNSLERKFCLFMYSFELEARELAKDVRKIHKKLCTVGSQASLALFHCVNKCCFVTHYIYNYWQHGSINKNPTSENTKLLKVDIIFESLFEHTKHILSLLLRCHQTICISISEHDVVFITTIIGVTNLCLLRYVVGLTFSSKCLEII